MKYVVDMEHPMFQPIKSVVKITGFSEWYLRQGLKAGTIPHIRSGNRILINLPKFMEELDKQTSCNPVEQ